MRAGGCVRNRSRVTRGLVGPCSVVQAPTRLTTSGHDGAGQSTERPGRETIAATAVRCAVGRPQVRTHHHRVGRVAAALACSAVLLAAAACTDADGAPEPTEGPRTTSLAPTTQPSTSPPPAPEEEAAAAALTALDGYWQVTQAYQQAPAARNWEPEIRQHADDTATAVGLSFIQTLLEYGIKQVGADSIEPEVTAIDLAANPGPTVTITACYDSRGARSIFVETGEPAVDDPEIPRWQLLVTVIQYPQQEGSPWLVHSSEPQLEMPC